MKNKLIAIEQIVEMIPDGAVLMVGGFLGDGTPDLLVDALLESGKKDFTIIANDTAFPDKGIGKLVANKVVKKVIVSHIGTNPETQKQMIDGSLEVELVPQGTLAEKIRAGGYGLGGILTPTGVGTIAEDDKQKITIDGKDFLVEVALKADFALIKAKKADFYGNLTFNLTSRNFNPLMAFAAETTIAQVEEIVPVGGLVPDEVVVPHAVVDYIVRGDVK
ncbi:MAG: acetate CoA-transferase subunit alpha [Thermotogaceae bacterium]|nr:acetate CoA-transferase subunit alpha [Thermotogaceae bacterium]